MKEKKKKKKKEAVRARPTIGIHHKFRSGLVFGFFFSKIESSIFLLFLGPCMYSSSFLSRSLLLGDENLKGWVSVMKILELVRCMGRDLFLFENPEPTITTTLSVS